MEADARYALPTVEAETVVIKGIREGHVKKLPLEERLEGQGVNYVGYQRDFSRRRHFPGTGLRPVWLKLCGPGRE